MSKTLAVLAAMSEWVRGQRQRLMAIPCSWFRTPSSSIQPCMTECPLQALPDVPTMAEAGYPDIEGEAWFAVIVPARTPKEIIALLHSEIVKTIALPDMKERMATLGLDPVGSSPEECAAQFRTEAAKWAKVIREAGIKAQ